MTPSPWPRLASGVLACRDCNGSGIEDVTTGDPNDPAAITVHTFCVFCGGTGATRCSAHGCREHAKVVGEGGVFAYCTVGHAFEDDDYPGCLSCGARPQDPACSPWCSIECEQKTLSAIQANQLKRWEERIAKDNAEHEAKREGRTP